MAANKDEAPKTDAPKVDARKVDKDPVSTWGATEEAKQQWETAHGDKTRKANARRSKENEAE